ncbi:benzoylformate decarboxylase [Amycolatopsis sp. FDAARGOS 1241]|uniref:benzoylformate decarboxylase n=1 Tax=Amycolatopsis sp. FDAARGOS 1241 TaxID=2778070 RepID=UPI0019512554|nr:benzoylformate decarboxylase [Amycolatopsis sp. FDAARGOS 1241]QRP46747.1 benzoylformate decarboxylase [Amycolatopsis sp. FDAARGOS 1241]
MRTIRDATRELLRNLGLTTVFGNPGTTEIAFLTEWPDDFTYVLGLQESAVVAMADGYAQATRKPVLVNLHSAGGVGHSLGHVFTAFRDRAPLIVLAGQQTRSLLPDEPFLGAVEAANFPKPYVKWSIEPARAQDVPAAIAHAYYVATQAPQGPVFVSVPVDDWDAEATMPLPTGTRTPGFAPDPEALRELADALDSAGNPALVVGASVDADGAVPDVVDLAEKLGAGVWAAPMSSRCSFPEDHELFLGFLQPERKAVAEALREHDVVVVLGAPAFTYHVYRGEPGEPLPPLYLVSDDEQILARAGTGTGIRSTPKLAIRALIERVTAKTRETKPRPEKPARPAETTPISPDFAYATVAELLPDNAIVVEETPSHRNCLHDHLPITSTDTGFLTVASGTLGYGLPAAVGAALGRPDRKVVAVLGDGSSMYCVQALWTAARENAPVTFVVLDNAQYAAVRILGETAGGTKVPGTDLGGIDFAQLAQSMGVPARTVEQGADLRDALANALAENGPRLVHVKVDPNPQTLY